MNIMSAYKTSLFRRLSIVFVKLHRNEDNFGILFACLMADSIILNKVLESILQKFS